MGLFPKRQSKRPIGRGDMVSVLSYAKYAGVLLGKQDAGRRLGGFERPGKGVCADFDALGGPKSPPANPTFTLIVKRLSVLTSAV